MNVDQSFDFLLCKITRAHIEAVDTSPLLERYDVASMSPAKLQALFGRIIFYPCDYSESGELYGIPAIRDFLRAWRAQWPYLLFFGYIGDDILKMLYFSLLNKLKYVTVEDGERCSVEYDRNEMAALLAEDLAIADSLAVTAGIDCETRQARIEALIHYFGME